jgi:hypothetical protein
MRQNHHDIWSLHEVRTPFDGVPAQSGGDEDIVPILKPVAKFCHEQVLAMVLEPVFKTVLEEGDPLQMFAVIAQGRGTAIVGAGRDSGA